MQALSEGNIGLHIQCVWSQESTEMGYSLWSRKLKEASWRRWNSGLTSKDRVGFIREEGREGVGAFSTPWVQVLIGHSGAHGATQTQWRVIENRSRHDSTWRPIDHLARFLCPLRSQACFEYNRGGKHNGHHTQYKLYGCVCVCIIVSIPFETHIYTYICIY